MPIAAPAMVVKPSTPAISATTRKVRAQPSIGFSPSARRHGATGRVNAVGAAPFPLALRRRGPVCEDAGDHGAQDPRVPDDHRSGGAPHPQGHHPPPPPPLPPPPRPVH